MLPPITAAKRRPARAGNGHSDAHSGARRRSQNRWESKHPALDSDSIALRSSTSRLHVSASTVAEKMHVPSCNATPATFSALRPLSPSPCFPVRAQDPCSADVRSPQDSCPKIFRSRSETAKCEQKAKCEQNLCMSDVWTPKALCQKSYRSHSGKAWKFFSAAAVKCPFGLSSSGSQDRSQCPCKEEELEAECQH